MPHDGQDWRVDQEPLLLSQNLVLVVRCHFSISPLEGPWRLSGNPKKGKLALVLGRTSCFSSDLCPMTSIQKSVCLSCLGHGGLKGRRF